MNDIIKIGRLSIVAIILWACANQSLDTPEAIQRRLSQLREEREKIEEEIKKLERKLMELDTLQTEKRQLVDVIKIAYQPFVHYLSIHGEVVSDQNVTISSEIGGQVIAIYVDEGQWVKKGTPLIKLDDRAIRHSIEEVEIQLALARELYEKQERLWKDSIGSEVQYLQAKTQKEALEKRLATLQTQLLKTTIRAPFSGKVDRIYIKVGQIAAPGIPLLQLIGQGKMKIELKVPESYTQYIKSGQNVEYYVPDLRMKGKGIVSNVGEGIDPVSRTFIVEVTPIGKLDLKPHMAVEAYLQDYENPKSIVIPTDVISKDEEGNYYVYVVEKRGQDWVAQRRYIKIGYWQGNRVEVQNGLQEGDLVVYTGHKFLVPDQYVTIVNTYEGGKE